MTSNITLLPSEVLPLIFKCLSSKEMVKTRRVARTFKDIIDSNRSLWQVLILQSNEVDWTPKIIDLFDRYSGSTLREVSIHSELEGEFTIHSEFKETGVNYLIQVLERSKATLRFLHLRICSNWGDLLSLTDLTTCLTNSLELRIESSFLRPRPPVTTVLVESDESGSNREASSKESIYPLQIFWTTGFGVDSFEDIKNLVLGSNLKSFRMTSYLKHEDLRAMLENCSRTLKDLEIALRVPTGLDLPQLDFPKLSSLTLSVDPGCEEFPSWISIPTSSSLVLKGDDASLLSSLPSVRELWILGDMIGSDLVRRCPTLETIRFMNEDLPTYFNLVLFGFLAERKANVKAGLKVDGVEMKSLKTVIVPSNQFDKVQEGATRVNDLVEELVNLKDAPRFIEVEI